MPSAVLIPVVGGLRRVTFGTLEEMQALVGGYVEVLRVAHPSGALLFCNEDGKRLRLRPNPRASLVAALPAGQYIVGDAFVSGSANSHGDETDVPADVAAWLFRLWPGGAER